MSRILYVKPINLDLLSQEEEEYLIDNFKCETIMDFEIKEVED